MFTIIALFSAFGLAEDAGDVEAAECRSQIWSQEGRHKVDCVEQCPFPRGLRMVGKTLVCGICPLETPYISRATGRCMRAARCTQRTFWLNNIEESADSFYKEVNFKGCVICEDEDDVDVDGKIVYPSGEAINFNRPEEMVFYATTSAGDAIRMLFMSRNGSFYRSVNNSEYMEPAWVNGSKLHSVTGIYPAIRNFLLTTEDGYLFYDWEKDAGGNVTRCNVEAAAGDSRRLVLVVDVCDSAGWKPVESFSSCDVAWKQRIIFWGECALNYCGESGHGDQEVLEGKLLGLSFQNTAVASVYLNREEVVFRLSNGSLYVGGVYAGGCGLSSTQRFVQVQKEAAMSFQASKFVQIKGKGYVVAQIPSSLLADRDIFTLQACGKTMARPDENRIFPVDVQEQMYCTGLGCSKTETRAFVLMSNGTVRVKDFALLDDLPALQEDKGYVEASERDLFAARDEFVLSYPNLTTTSRQVDQGYCYEGQCICGKGFRVSNDKLECISVCPAGTALLEPLNWCAGFGDLIYANYSDFGTPTKPQQRIICPHSSFVVKAQGCVCPELHKYIEHGLILRENWRCTRECTGLYLTPDGRNCVPSCPALGFFTWEETRECTTACGPNQLNLSIGGHGTDYCACFEGTYRNGRFCDVLGPRCPRLSQSGVCQELCGEGLFVGKDGYQCVLSCEDQFKYWFKEKINGDWFCRKQKWIYVKLASIGAAFVPPFVGFVGWFIVLCIQAKKPPKDMVFKDAKGRAVDGKGNLISDLNLVAGQNEAKKTGQPAQGQINQQAAQQPVEKQLQ